MPSPVEDAGRIANADEAVASEGGHADGMLAVRGGLQPHLAVDVLGGVDGPGLCCI